MLKPCLFFLVSAVFTCLVFIFILHPNWFLLRSRSYLMRTFYIYLEIFTFFSFVCLSFRSLDAEVRLQQLEAEREHLGAELRAAREKVKRAEEAQLLLETQVVTPTLRGGERIRRTQSLIPTPERPLSIEKINNRPIVLQKNDWCTCTDKEVFFLSRKLL